MVHAKMSTTSALRVSSLCITGANRGIGLEFVKQLTQLPQPPKHIFATCRNPDAAKELQDLASKHQCIHILKLDVGKPEEYAGLVKSVETTLNGEGLNLLINNAGIASSTGRELANVTAESMMEVYRINTVAPLLLAREFLPLLKKATASTAAAGTFRAAIVNMSSIVGSIDDNRLGKGHAYRSSKAALNMVTKSLSVDLKPDGIIAVVLHPGWVQTDMGGPDALINTTTSVSELLNTIGGLTEQTSGAFLNYDGAPIPW